MYTILSKLKPKALFFLALRAYIQVSVDGSHPTPFEQKCSGLYSLSPNGHCHMVARPQSSILDHLYWVSSIQYDDLSLCLEKFYDFSSNMFHKLTTSITSLVIFFLPRCSFWRDNSDSDKLQTFQLIKEVGPYFPGQRTRKIIYFDACFPSQQRAQ